MKIDKLDQKILNLLQSNADITNEALGKLVFVSAATCQRRIRRLKDIGAIEKVVAVANPAAIGVPLIAVVEITMTSQTVEILSGFEAKVHSLAAVQQCYRVSTGPDFILIVGLTNMQAYHDFAADLFSADNDVRNVRTFFSVLRSKFGVNLPVNL